MKDSQIGWNVILILMLSDNAQDYFLRAPRLSSFPGDRHSARGHRIHLSGGAVRDVLDPRLRQ